ncbi:MAG: hypothetical protein ACFFAU_19110 [Candidatus Hodarchaeota archaeon]
METEVVDPKDLYLEESDFVEIKYSKPTSYIFVLSCFLVYSLISCLVLLWSLESETIIGFIVLYIILFFVYSFLMVNRRTQVFIRKQRLKRTLNYYRKAKITFDYVLDEFSYDPKSPPTIGSYFLHFYLVFLAELFVITFSTNILFGILPNLTDLQMLFYSTGFIIVSFGFLTFAVLQGTWNWNRNPNYFAESFYYLKAYIIGDEKDPVFVFTSKALNSFFKLLYVNEIPINFDESKLEDLGWVIEFFSPENKAIGEDLETNLLKILLHLKERKWLETLLTIEKIEKNLEEAKNKLGSTYLKKEYVKDESFIKKWILPVQKEFIATLMKLIVPSLITLALLVLQGFIN